MPLNDEEVKDAKEKVERYKELRQNWEQVDENGNRVLVGTEEMDAIDNELTSKLIDPLADKLSAEVKKMANIEGQPSKQEIAEKSIKQYNENKKTQQEQFAEIQAGIVNEAAKAHVSNLVKEITSLRKEIVKKQFEVKMLQKNGAVLVEELNQEIQEMKLYLVGVTGVFETFVGRISEKLNKRESGLNESRGDKEGRAESN